MSVIDLVREGTIWVIDPPTIEEQTQKLFREMAEELRDEFNTVSPKPKTIIVIRRGNGHLGFADELRRLKLPVKLGYVKRVRTGLEKQKSSP